MTDDLRERIEAALRKSYERDHEWPDGWPEWALEMLGRDTDAVMAVVQPELDRLKSGYLKAAESVADLVLERGKRQREHNADREKLEELRAWKAKALAVLDPCECCTFGHHHTPCTCLGLLVCCHPESHDQPAEPFEDHVAR